MGALAAVRNQDHAVAEGINFTQSWLAGQLSGQTARAYRADIGQFLEFVGTDDLTQIGRGDLFDYRAHLCQEYAPATTNRKLSAIRQLFVEAVRHEVIEHDPAAGLKGYTVDSSYSSTLAPSKEQVQELLDSLRGDGLLEVRDRAMLYVLATMGLRREEVSNLTTASLVEDGGKQALDVIGKGSKRRRLEIPKTTMIALQAWMEVGQFGEGVPLFQSISATGGHHVTGKQLSPGGVYYVCLRRMDAVGMTGLSPHSLRHFLVTFLLGQGGNLYRVQQVCGHSDPRTTERYDAAKHGTASVAAELIDF